jgi:Fe2+ transport system protein FeoA
MSLKEMKTGTTATVIQVPEGDLRHQLLRFGITPGCRVKCCARLPMGPVVVRFGGQEIALGREIASQVRVRADDI